MRASDQVEPVTEPCAGPGCYRPARAAGLCFSHFKQLQRHGRTFRLARYHRSILPSRTAVLTSSPTQEQ